MSNITFVVTQVESFIASVPLDHLEWRDLFGTEYNDSTVTELQVQAYMDHTKYPMTKSAPVSRGSLWNAFEEEVEWQLNEPISSPGRW